MRYELRKVYCHRYYFIVLAVMILINGFSFFQYAVFQGDGYSEIQMQQVYLTSGSLYELEAELRDCIFGSESSNVSDLITGNVYSEWNLVSSALERIQETENYSQYIEQLIQEATIKINSGVFGKAEEYSIKALHYSVETYQQFQGQQLPVLFTGGYRCLTEFTLTDVFVVLMGCMSVCILIIQERSSGTLCLIKPTKYGNSRLYFYKYGAVVVVVLTGAIILYGSNIGLTALLFGMDHLSAPIQAVNELKNCPFAISIAEYLFCYYILKMLWCLAVTSLFWMLSCLTSQVMMTLLSVFALLITAIITAYQSNPWIKTLNLLCQMDTNSQLGTLTLLNCFEEPVSALTVVICELVFLVFGSFFAAYLCFRKVAAIPKTRKAGLAPLPLGRHTNLWRHEGFKLSVLLGGSLALCCLLFSQYIEYHSFSVNNSEWEYHYRRYSEILSGVPNEEKANFLTREEAKFEEIQASIESYAMTCGDDIGKFELLTQNLQRQMMAWSPFKYAQEQYNGLNENEVYIYQTGYKYLLGEIGRADDAENTIKFAITIIVTLSGFFSIEDETGMTVLIMSSRDRNRVLRTKKIAALIYMILALIIAYLPQYVVVEDAYGLSQLSAPASSIELMADYPIWCKIWMVFAAAWICRFLIGLATVFAVVFLSRKTKSAMISTVIGISILVLLWALCVLR